MEPELASDIPSTYRMQLNQFAFIWKVKLQSTQTTGIVELHLLGSEVSVRWSEVFPYKRKTTGEVK